MMFRSLSVLLLTEIFFLVNESHAAAHEEPSQRYQALLTARTNSRVVVNTTQGSMLSPRPSENIIGGGDDEAAIVYGTPALAG